LTISTTGWGRRFDEPIQAGKRELVTLRDAGEFIAALPKAQHHRPEWQLAMSMLLQAAEAAASSCWRGSR
jgi:hypothetical protein